MAEIQRLRENKNFGVNYFFLGPLELCNFFKLKK